MVEETTRFSLHGLGKEGVIAIPLLLSLDGLQEKTGALHCFQDSLAVSSPRHGIAEGSRQTVEHACLKEKGLQRLWLDVQHFSHKVVQQVPLFARESGEELFDILRIAC